MASLLISPSDMSSTKTRSVSRAEQRPCTLDPCLQSQIGQGGHLARRRTAQVMAAVELSVGVRMRPLGSVVNGTVVARPAMSVG